MNSASVFCSVSKRDDQFQLVKHAVDTFGQVDVFVNNAGVEDVMPLERVAAVLQHVHSNYEIDLFVNLRAAAATAVKDAGGTPETGPILPESMALVASSYFFWSSSRPARRTPAIGLKPGSLLFFITLTSAARQAAGS